MNSEVDVKLDRYLKKMIAIIVIGSIEKQHKTNANEAQNS